MKNLTISLDEQLARQVRVEAAKAGMSMSRWIATRLTEIVSGTNNQRAGLDALLALPLAPISRSGRLPTRSELHDREVFRRYERDRVHTGSKRPRKAGAGN
jgi:hypothetical protein